MMSYQKARFALWHHESQGIVDPVKWRITPKSKKHVAVVRPVALAGTVLVISATANEIKVGISDTQASAIAHWVSGLPPCTLPSSAETDRTITQTGPYQCIDSKYLAAQCPMPGDRVYVRLAVGVDNIGPLKKTQLEITDVRLNDVAQSQ